MTSNRTAQIFKRFYDQEVKHNYFNTIKTLGSANQTKPRCILRVELEFNWHN
jgi:hypothetical protein